MIFNLIGIGSKGLQQITLEGLEALKKSKKILSFQVNPEEMAHFAEEHDLEKIEYIDAFYQNNSRDNTNYERIIDYCLETMKDLPQVSLLLQGHPLFGVTISQRLRRRETKTTEIRAFSAPSSFDNMLIDLWRDPIDRGTQILDANRLLLFDFQINPSLDLYLYHICSIGNSLTNFIRPWQNNRMDLLVHKLAHFYPDDHPATLIFSNAPRESNGVFTTQMIESKIGILESEIRNIHFGMTLYIPPTNPSRIDKSFLRLLNLESDDH
jgi:uncharacterized protein YabN with tetrapyrrole methylase and pyrophosphatase domain